MRRTSACAAARNGSSPLRTSESVTLPASTTSSKPNCCTALKAISLQVARPRRPVTLDKLGRQILLDTRELECYVNRKVGSLMMKLPHGA